MEGLKLCFMTFWLLSFYNKWIPDFILACHFIVAAQTFELLAIVPQKNCVPLGFLGGFFSEYRYFHSILESNALFAAWQPELYESKLLNFKNT